MAQPKDRATYSFYEKTTPAEQAKQPNEAKKEKPEVPITKEAWSKLRGHLEGRLSMLRTWRDTWWISNYSDLARFILPRRSI